MDFEITGIISEMSHGISDTKKLLRIPLASSLNFLKMGLEKMLKTDAASTSTKISG
jgi:hypothetical protein